MMQKLKNTFRHFKENTRISSMQINLALMFGLLFAAMVVSIVVFANLSAQEIDREKEIYRTETVNTFLSYAALASAGGNAEKAQELMDTSAPVRGQLYVLDAARGEIVAAGGTGKDLPYEQDVIEEDIKADAQEQKNVLKYEGADGRTDYLFYAAVPDGADILLYLVDGEELLAGNMGTPQPVVILTIVLVIAFVIIIYVFNKNIIKPIFLIERTVHGMVAGRSGDFAVIPENHPLHSLYADLQNMIEKYQSMVAKEYSTGIMKKQAELDALQSQINPHLLYNTLDSIRGIAIAQGADNIEAMTKALSDMFRYSISRKGPQVKLKEELANIRNYIMIQQYRFNDKFTVAETIEPDVRDCLIPKLIVQPIVENAVFHGLEPKQGHGNISIQAYRTEKRLIILIEDDGIGMPREDLIDLNDCLVSGKDVEPHGTSHTSSGLFNVNKRIRLHYGEEYGLRIYGSESHGTSVEISLPIQKDEQ